MIENSTQNVGKVIKEKIKYHPIKIKAETVGHVWRRSRLRDRTWLVIFCHAGSVTYEGIFD